MIRIEPIRHLINDDVEIEGGSGTEVELTEVQRMIRSQLSVSNEAKFICMYEWRKNLKFGGLFEVLKLLSKHSHEQQMAFIISLN